MIIQVTYKCSQKLTNENTGIHGQPLLHIYLQYHKKIVEDRRHDSLRQCLSSSNVEVLIMLTWDQGVTVEALWDQGVKVVALSKLQFDLETVAFELKQVCGLFSGVDSLNAAAWIEFFRPQK
jgi:hypothetical protein